MSSRYLKDLEIRKSKIIHIYRNGDAYSRAIFVILRLVEQTELERIIKAIEEKVKLPLNRPIRKLFDMTGTIIQNPAQIEDGKYYVAGSAENFFALEYGQPGSWVLVGPVKTNKYANVNFITKSEDEGKPTKLSTSNNVLSNKSATNINNSSKKPKVRKTSLTKKKPVGSKGFINKGMAASEHVDKILDSYEIEDVNKPEIQPEIEPSEEIPTEDIQNINHNEDKNKDETPSNEESNEVHSTDEKNQQPIVDHSQQSDHIGTTSNELITDPVVIPQDNLPSDDNELDMQEKPNDTNENDLSKIPPEDEPIKSEIPNKTSDEIDSQIYENGTSEVLETNEKNPEISGDDLENNAATKIQATFRGYQVRSEMGKAKDQEFQVSVDESAENSEITNPTDNI